MAPKKDKKSNQSQVINITINGNQEIELSYDENDQDFENCDETTIEGGIKYVVVENYDKNHKESDGDRTDELGSDENGSDVEEVVEHVCGKCNKTFSEIIDLKKHLPFCRENSEANLRKQEMFQNLPQIEKECKQMESKDLCFCCNENFDVCHAGHIRCTECPKSFKNSSSFERHIFLSHSDVDKFPCGICNARCPSKIILEIHTSNHERRGKKYACRKCGKEFTRQYHVVRHTKFSQCDPTVEKTEFACNVCNKVFYRIDNLRHHLRTHLGENNKTRDYQCPFCDKSFYGTSTLNIHIRTHTGERPFSCDLCEKYFPSNAALRKHRRYHTGEKPYECAVCKRSFTAKEVLNRHMKTHTGEKPHSCKICDKSFIQATQLRKHLLNHDDPKGFDCPLCSEKFNRKSKLSKHLIDDHASDVGFDCKECQSSFKSAAGLKRHNTRMHTKVETEDSFACDICDEEFVDQQSLLFHMVTHHDEKNIDDDSVQVIDTFQCSVCFHSFKNERGFNIHMKRVHKDHENNSNPNNETRILNGTITSNIHLPQIIEKPRKNSVSVDDELEIKKEYFDTINLTEKNKKNDSSKLVIIEEFVEMDECAPSSAGIKKQTPSKSDVEFNENVRKLLNFLIDQKTLRKFGWPSAPVEEVLQKVISNCGHKLGDIDKSYDYSTRMRQFVKILFTVVIDNEEIKELLNNLTIDEVIEHVLNMAEEDD